MNHLVEIRNLVKHFPLGRGQVVHAVDDVSLDIAAREIVGLVGESGSGKSTLGKTVLGLHEKTSGEVVYKGEPLPTKYRPPDFRRHARTMQMIFQDPYSSLKPAHDRGRNRRRGPEAAHGSRCRRHPREGR